MTGYDAYDGRADRAGAPRTRVMPASTDENPEDRTDELRQDIARARAELSETIAALEERVSPHYLKEQATATIRDLREDATAQAREAIRDALDRTTATARGATSGAEQLVQSARAAAKDTGYTVTGAITRHPIAAALAGIGVGLLLMVLWSSASQPRRPRYRFLRRR